MEKVLINLLVWGNFIAIFSLFSCEGERVFYHEGNLLDRITITFNKKPSMRVEHKTANGKQSLNLFIPGSFDTLMQDFSTINKKVTQRKSTSCVFVVKQVHVPEKGLSIYITYDQAKPVCNYDISETIAGKYSLIISLYNNEAICKLKEKTEPLLKHASLYPLQKKPTIVIDCGHGGSDKGKVGFNAIEEKNINLSIGKHVASLLRKRGYAVNLTRTQDIDVPLDQRTSCSNRWQGDIFLSIHSNGTASCRPQGIETMWASTGGLLKENNVKELHALFIKKDKASKLLAEQVHKNILATARKFYQPCDRRVKESAYQVLIGTEMPSALVEVGFLSHEQEASLLIKPAYQKALAEGICKGIEDYFAGLSLL